MKRRSNFVTLIFAALLVASLCCVMFTACGEKKFIDIKFSENNIIMNIGETRDVSNLLVVDPADKKDDVVWSSSNDEAAQVVDGRVTISEYAEVVVVEAAVDDFKALLSIRVKDNGGAKYEDDEYSQVYFELPDYGKTPDGMIDTFVRFDVEGLALNAGENEHFAFRFNGSLRGNNDFDYSITLEDETLCTFDNFETYVFDFEWNEDKLSELSEEDKDFYLYNEDENYRVYFDCTPLKAGRTNATFTVGGKAIDFEIIVGEANYTKGLEYGSSIEEYGLFSLNGNGYAVKGLGEATDTEIVVPVAYRGLPVVAIGEEAFKDNSNITSVKLPDTIEQIGDKAFNNCSKLESVIMSQQLQAICGEAFYKCAKIESIEIPKSVHTIEYWAFRGCTGLTNIEVAAFGFNGTINDSAPGNRTGLKDVFNLDQETFVDYYYDDEVAIAYADRTIKVSDGITEIPDEAFNGCSQLKNIVLPDGIISIGNNALKGCSSLTAIDLPSSLTTIGEYAICACAGITEIQLPANVKTIGDHAFYNCLNLAEINLPDGLQTIGASAFEGCEALENITLPQGLQTLGIEAFKGCIKLTEMTIPEGYTTLPDGLFQGCSTLHTVHLPNSLTSIGGNVFMNCILLINVTIPSNVNTIGISAFNGCASLTTIALPAGLSVIEQQLFRNCSDLQTVTVPSASALVTIKFAAFWGCEKLQSLVLPDGFLEIGQQAFSGCSKLETLVVGESLQKIGDNAFNQCYALRQLILPVTLQEIGNHGAFTVGNIGSTYYYIDVYYEGSLIQWNSFADKDSKYTDTYSFADDDHIYIYSQSSPSSTTNKWGGYWHYNNQQVPTVWGN